MTLDCLWRFKLNLRLHQISLPRLICASVRSGPIVIHGPDRSVGLRCFWIGLGSVRSKFILESVRSDSISKIVGPAHWTEPNRDRTDVVHPWSQSMQSGFIDLISCKHLLKSVSVVALAAFQSILFKSM